MTLWVRLFECPCPCVCVVCSFLSDTVSLNCFLCTHLKHWSKKEGERAYMYLSLRRLHFYIGSVLLCQFFTHFFSLAILQQHITLDLKERENKISLVGGGSSFFSSFLHWLEFWVDFSSISTSTSILVLFVTSSMSIEIVGERPGVGVWVLWDLE